MMKSIKFFCFAAVCAAFLMTACGPAPTADEWMRKSLASAKEAKWGRALDQAENAVAKAPGSTLANVLLAIALEHNNRPEEALNVAIRAGADTSSFIAQYTLGRLYCRQGKYDSSVKPLTRALELRPDDENTLILLARAKLRLNTEDAVSLKVGQAVRDTNARWAETPVQNLAVGRHLDQETHGGTLLARVQAGQVAAQMLRKHRDRGGWQVKRKRSLGGNLV